MVQVFGNRIIGGVGAPDPRMSEAFGAGVTTALGQRSSRQEMNFRAQDQQFKIEDREEAKRRRAAADAAAGAARAKAAALNEQYIKIFGAGAGDTRVPGLNVPATAGPGRDRQGPTAAPTTATTAPAPTAGVRIEAGPRQPLTYGSGTVISGGAGSASVGGGTGTDRLGATTAPTFYTPGTGDLSARPGDFAARATQERVAAIESARAAGLTEPTSAQRQLALAQGQAAMFDEEFARTNDPEDYAEAARWRAEVTRLTPLVNSLTVATQGGFADRGLLAAEGPESVTIQGPNGPITVPAVTQPTPVTTPDGSTLPLSTGTPVSAQPTQLTFGPRLGAMPQTQEELMIDDFVRTQPARGTAAPAPPRMGEPGAPNRAITQLLAQRDQQAQWAQALIAAGQYADAQTVQTEIMNIDTKLEAAVGRLALNEAVMFNAPQRLNAVWSDISGQQYEFVPTAQGGFDVYVNGELLDQNLSMDVIEANTLSMTDQVYAAQQSELATLTATERAKGMGAAEANIYEYEQKAAIDADKALQVGLTEIDLLTMKRDLGFGDQDQIDFQKDENTGIILVLRNGELAGQYAPMTTAGPTGEAVTRYELIQ
jgi:hypothetical protein